MRDGLTLSAPGAHANSWQPSEIMQGEVVLAGCMRDATNRVNHRDTPGDRTP